MNRLEKIRDIVNGILMNNSDLEERHCGFVHLYGVSSICRLLALKRGLDAELCGIAGMLHDISSYKLGTSIDSKIFDGSVHDDVCYSITKEEYFNR